MRKCIFCRGTGKSREHVSPQWTHSLVPPQAGSFYKEKILGEILVADRKIQRYPASRIDVPIDLAHVQVHGPCARCNSGWMSEIESAVRPIVTDMLSDNKRAISVSEQLSLASWITLKAVINELLDTEHVVVSDDERRSFYENRLPFATSQVHIARYSGDGPARHTITRAYMYIGGNLPNPVYRGKFTMFKLGNILMAHGYLVPPEENRVHHTQVFLPPPRSALPSTTWQHWLAACVFNG
jgi:hypothetical protein